MTDLGVCPICTALIIRSETNPDAHHPYQPRVMWICQHGHRIAEPDRTERG